MTELRGGLIGCGYFARNHLFGWSEVRGAGIVALCDRQKERAQAYGREFGIEATFDDAATMIRSSRLDFVDIVTTPETHRELVEQAAALGVHVICQKPLAPSLGDARAIADACATAAVRSMVHENFRWQTPMREVKAASAALGELHFLRLTFHSGHDVYANQPYLATDERFIIYDLGVHLLDLARFFAGEFETVWCQTARVNPRIRGEDLATIMLRGRGGATAIVEVSYGSKPTEEHFPQTLVHLEGRHGTARLGPGFELEVRGPDGVSLREVRPRVLSWSRSPAEAIQESVLRIQQHWVDCVAAGRDPETTCADNLRTLELVFGAYESAESGRPYRARVPDGV